MDEGARRWLFKTVRKNYWRVARWYDVDDLVQEGHAAYCEVLKRYPGAVDPPHRMRLFQLVFMSRLHDLANERTRGPIEDCEADLLAARGEEVLDSPLAATAAQPSLFEALPLIASAPQYVRDALALFASEDGLRRVRAPYRKMRVGKHLVRETLNERLCRLTGHDPGEVDIVGGIKACLERD